MVSHMVQILDTLGTLNSNSEYDFLSALNPYVDNLNDPFNIDINPFSNLNINCKFYNEDSFFSEFESCTDILLLSDNIQSKFSGFCEFISQVKKKNIVFNIIAIQEIWFLTDPDKFYIPGYQKFIFKSRN